VEKARCNSTGMFSSVSSSLAILNFLQPFCLYVSRNFSHISFSFLLFVPPIAIFLLLSSFVCPFRVFTPFPRHVVTEQQWRTKKPSYALRHLNGLHKSRYCLDTAEASTSERNFVSYSYNGHRPHGWYKHFTNFHRQRCIICWETNASRQIILWNSNFCSVE
jgi:hypothetical protein